MDLFVFIVVLCASSWTVVAEPFSCSIVCPKEKLMFRGVAYCCPTGYNPVVTQKMEDMILTPECICVLSAHNSMALSGGIQSVAPVATTASSSSPTVPVQPSLQTAYPPAESAPTHPIQPVQHSGHHTPNNHLAAPKAQVPPPPPPQPVGIPALPPLVPLPRFQTRVQPQTQQRAQSKPLYNNRHQIRKQHYIPHNTNIRIRHRLPVYRTVPQVHRRSSAYIQKVPNTYNYANSYQRSAPNPTSYVPSLYPHHTQNVPSRFQVPYQRVQNVPR